MGVQRKKKIVPRAWGTEKRPKGQIQFNFNNKVKSKIFIPNFVCVLANERYNVYQMGCSLCRLGYALGMIHVMWHIKLTGVISRTECMNILP